MPSSCLLLTESEKLSADLAKALPAEVCLQILPPSERAELLPQKIAFALVDCREDGEAAWQNALAELKEVASDNFPVIAICRPEALAAVRRALQHGADSYLFTPLRKAETCRVIEQCLGGARYATGPGRALPSDEILFTQGFCGFIGASEPMKEVYRQILKVALADSSVLIRGESGTGKELAARALHRLGRRSGKPFVPVNCGAIPRDLLESELFGYVKGAFTGAHSDRIGRVEMAEGGTIFLDEIGDMEPLLQVKILRLLQEKTIEPLGWRKEPKRVDVRIVSATNRDLEQDIISEKFREDLYYRLNVVPLKLPPLRQRPGDIEGLAEFFLERFNAGFESADKVSGITPEALWLLQNHNWPGNVRELENVIERAAVMNPGGWIMPQDLPEKFFQPDSGPDHEAALGGSSFTLPAAGLSLKSEVTRLEKELIAEALKRAHGVKEQAARLLQINRTTLIEKIRRNQLEEDAS
ncbi:MAG: sigma-54-dependent Fis family transcriptional regulator [Deltaproteobacteria bacterium]|nr:sigma-54-dependent Fis family transcriptional regulator [Deltaproteobacteria bacterium]